MSTENLFAVILAGGSGTRLWPVSTADRPKQFRRLVGERTLLQLTCDRLAGLVGPERTLVLTNQAFAGLVAEQLPEMPADNVVVEPMMRDTAAAIGLGAVVGRARFGADATMAVLPADHVIEPRDRFQQTLSAAARGAQTPGVLYTFGIPPTRPATGYGYLERGDAVAGDLPGAHFALQRFREKPNRELAEEFVASGRFFWNSGIFVWRVASIWDELVRHLPAHAEALGALERHVGTAEFPAALTQAFEPLERISIDFGVTERARTVRMVAADFTWSDIGGWPALADFMSHDDDENAHRGALRVADAAGNIVFCEDPQEVVALVGVDDLIVVRAGSKTLVAPRARAQEIKALVEKLKTEGLA